MNCDDDLDLGTFLVNIRTSHQTSTSQNLDAIRLCLPSQLTQVHVDGTQIDSGNETAAEFEWITDLEASSSYWDGWFHDLSSRFLDCRCGRILILAGMILI